MIKHQNTPETVDLEYGRIGAGPVATGTNVHTYSGAISLVSTSIVDYYVVS